MSFHIQSYVPTMAKPNTPQDRASIEAGAKQLASEAAEGDWVELSVAPNALSAEEVTDPEGQTASLRSSLAANPQQAIAAQANLDAARTYALLNRD